MKRSIALLLAVVFCLLCAGCAAPKAQNGNSAVDAAILTAFDSPMAETEKALGVRFTEAAGDNTVYTAFVGTGTATWCGRDMETNIVYLQPEDVVQTLNARASYPLDDSAKAFLAACLTALKDQFGDPARCYYRAFPTDDGQPGDYTDADISGDGLQAVCDGLWSSEDLRSLEAQFPLPKADGSLDENGGRNIHFAFSKDENDETQVNVAFTLSYPGRTAQAQSAE